MPLSLIAEFINKATQIVKSTGGYKLSVFGHAGDGNLHVYLMDNDTCKKPDVAIITREDIFAYQ